MLFISRIVQLCIIGVLSVWLYNIGARHLGRPLSDLYMHEDEDTLPDGRYQDVLFELLTFR